MDCDSLQPCGDSIWIGTGPIVKAFGFPFPTRMIVVKLANGGIWINSPVEWAVEDMKAVARMGPVAHLVSPTPLHDWRLESWETLHRRTGAAISINSCSAAAAF